MFSSYAVLAIAATLVIGAGWLIWYSTSLDDRRPIAIGVMGLGAGFILLLLTVPHLQVGESLFLSAKDRIELQDKARSTLAQILGGVVLLVGIFTAVENLRTSQESEFTDRLVRCVQLLGTESRNGQKQIDSRVGAIHALAEISRESDRQQRVVMEILAAYVQTNAPMTFRIGERTGVLRNSPPDADVQAALNVLVGRNRKYDPPNGWLEVSFTRLIGADFSAGADVTNAKAGAIGALGKMRLVGSDLDQAFFTALDLRQTIFQSASLKDAFLNRTILDNADLSDTDLSGADLSWASLVNADFSGARMSKTRLFAADLTGAKLSQQQLNSTMGDTTVRLPQGLVRPSSWTVSHH